MAIGLTILLCLVSTGLLAGRIYEILKLTDLNTGFFIYKGIVFNPVILIIFAVITVCCGIIIFGNDIKVKSFFSQSSKIIAAAAGVMLLIYGIMSLKNDAVSFFIISGAVAMIAIGIFGLDAKSDFKNIAVIVLTLVFIVGLCMDVIVFDVKTIHNIEFIKNTLSYLTLALFLMFVMKNVYSPSKNSAVLLYITGILTFAICGMMNIADIVVMVIDGNSVLPDLFLNAGLAFAGFFALDNAVSVMPSKKEKSEQAEMDKEFYEENSEPEEEQITVEENTDILQNITDIEKSDSTDNASEEKNEFNKNEELITYFSAREDNTPAEENTENTPKKIIFSKNGLEKPKSVSKDAEKVVYKRPKN